jgi:hypothetical protein
MEKKGQGWIKPPQFSIKSSKALAQSASSGISGPQDWRAVESVRALASDNQGACRPRNIQGWNAVPALIHVKRTLAVATTVAAMTMGGAMMMTATTASAAPNTLAAEVCPEGDSGKINTSNDPATVTFTAPADKLVSGYCVKAGSGDPLFVTVDPPQKTVTIDHPSKPSVSHYSVFYTSVICPTVTATVTETETDTETVHHTATVTEKETKTETATATATVTEKETETETATATVTDTETATATVTDTETVTETVAGPTQTVVNTITLPAQTETITLPAQTETVTESGTTSTVTLPAQTETITLPGETMTVTNTVTNTVSVAPSEATSQPAETVTETVTNDVEVAPSEATETPDDTEVAGEQAEVPTAVAAGADQSESALPGGSRTLTVLGLLVATLGAALVGASAAARRKA